MLCGHLIQIIYYDGFLRFGKRFMIYAFYLGKQRLYVKYIKIRIKIFLKTVMSVLENEENKE